MSPSDRTRFEPCTYWPWQAPSIPFGVITHWAPSLRRPHRLPLRGHRPPAPAPCLPVAAGSPNPPAHRLAPCSMLGRRPRSGPAGWFIANLLGAHPSRPDGMDDLISSSTYGALGEGKKITWRWTATCGRARPRGRRSGVPHACVIAWWGSERVYTSLIII